MDTQTFQKLIDTLVVQGDIERVTVKTAGRQGAAYRIRGGEENASEVKEVSGKDVNEE